MWDIHCIINLYCLFSSHTYKSERARVKKICTWIDVMRIWFDQPTIRVDENVDIFEWIWNSSLPMRVPVLVDDRELWMPVVVIKVVFHQRVECQTVFLIHASMVFSMMPCHLTISIHVQSDYRKFQLINQFRKCLFPKALENSMNFRRRIFFLFFVFLRCNCHFIANFILPEILTNAFATIPMKQLAVYR